MSPILEEKYIKTAASQCRDFVDNKRLAACQRFYEGKHSDGVFCKETIQKNLAQLEITAADDVARLGILVTHEITLAECRRLEGISSGK